MQNELLLEIGSEEIPAGFIKPALENMQKAMAENLAEYDLQYEAIQTAATPRRLAICVRGLVSQQPDRKEEFLGPAKSAAFDAENNPTKAAAGFARSKGAKIEDLKIIDTLGAKKLKTCCRRSFITLLEKYPFLNPCVGVWGISHSRGLFTGCWRFMRAAGLNCRSVILPATRQPGGTVLCHQ